MDSTQSTFNKTSSLASKDYNDTLYSQLSDESYIKMEQDYRDEIEFENLLGSQEIPDLNDTLDEINFILELGNKLNLEGKLRTPNRKLSVKETQTSHSFKTATKFDENLNNSEEISGISFLIEKSEIRELNRLKKCPKPLNDTTANFEDASETQYFGDMSKNSEPNNSNDTVLMDDSWILDETQQTEDGSYFNSFMSEHGSSDESTTEDEDCCEASLRYENTLDQEDILEIDLTDEASDDSVIEILDD